MRIPEELFGVIALYCNDDTLASLAQTSRAVSFFAVRELYKDGQSRLPLSPAEHQMALQLRDAWARDSLAGPVPCHGVLDCKRPVKILVQSADGTYK
jgi:hypothetical protein